MQRNHLPKNGTSQPFGRSMADKSPLCHHRVEENNEGASKCRCQTGSTLPAECPSTRTLNGTQFTNDALVHTGLVTTAEWRFCKKCDSPKHRHWECEFFKDIRSKYPDIQHLSDEADECLLHHGWMPTTPSLRKLRETLLSLPDQTAEYKCPPSSACPPMYKELFIDGSDPVLGLNLGDCGMEWRNFLAGVKRWCSGMETNKFTRINFCSDCQLENSRPEPKAVQHLDRQRRSFCGSDTTATGPTTGPFQRT